MKRFRNEVIEDSYNFLRDKVDSAALFTEVPMVHKFVMNAVHKGPIRDGLFLEFGVFKGKTLNYFADELNKWKPQQKNLRI